MRVYWTLKSIPELSGLGFWERGRVWRAGVWASRFYLDWRWWASLVGLVAGVLAGFVVGYLIGRQVLGNEVLGSLLLGVPAWLLGMVWYSQAFVALIRPHIRRQD